MKRKTAVTVSDPQASEKILSNLKELIVSRNEWDSKKKLAIVCVGTDRSTGDCLGPLIGHMLSKVELPNTTVLGTIDKPVHAQSLSDAITVLDKLHDDHLIIAVDACLGTEENVGNINVRPGPLRPGSGINKTLPEVGDLHIIGIVNIGGYLEQFVLQTTRLALVMQMADIVSKSLFKLCRERYVITQQEIGCNKEVAAGSSDI